MFRYANQWRIATGAGVLTMVVVLHWLICPPSVFSKMLMHALWFLWAVGPPFWFLLEWRNYPGDAEFKGYMWNAQDGKIPSFATLKYSQELASKFWLAGLGLLTILHATQPSLMTSSKVSSEKCLLQLQLQPKNTSA